MIIHPGKKTESQRNIHTYMQDFNFFSSRILSIMPLITRKPLGGCLVVQKVTDKKK